MNERIKELAKQAGLQPSRQWIVSCDHEAGTFETEPCWEEFEKFAQLIVRECAELSVNSQYTNTKSEYYEGFNEALIYAGNKIRKHFGVE